jgi:hypothetical protein
MVDIGGTNSGGLEKITEYTAATGPASFGAGGPTNASSNSGVIFGVEAQNPLGPGIDVPFNHVSGSALSGSSTFDGQTFASLGLTPGTYVYTWAAAPPPTA